MTHQESSNISPEYRGLADKWKSDVSLGTAVREYFTSILGGSVRPKAIDTILQSTNASVQDQVPRESVEVIAANDPLFENTDKKAA